jgi:hypothetical protein
VQANSKFFSCEYFEYSSDKGPTLFGKASKNKKYCHRKQERGGVENLGKCGEGGGSRGGGVIISNIWLGFF